MHFRRSRNEDIEQILAIIEDARQFLASQQIDQWQGPYPDRTRIEEDIRLDISYVLEDSEVVGTAVLSFEPEECYRHIVGGAWLTEGENYGVIHRIAVQSAVRGKGYARRLFAELEQLAAQAGKKSMRVDTHAQNMAMQNTLQKSGYVRCGIVHLIGSSEDGDPRVAFEKVLK